ASLAHAVGDGDVPEAAVRFGAALDATGDMILVGSQLLRASEGAVEKSAEIVAGDLAVCDRHVFRRARGAERVGAFETNAIVIGRVYAGVGNAHVAAAINVETVAIGINLQVVNGEV